MTILNHTKHTVTLAHEGRTVTYTHAGRGFEYLEELLHHPGQPIACNHLRQLFQIEPHAVSRDDFTETDAATVPYCPDFPFLPISNPIEVADEQTLQEVKARLLDLIEGEQEASMYHDLARLEDIREEKTALLDYLKQALSKTGKPRYLHHQQRNDYSAVKQAILRAIDKLANDFPDLTQDLKSRLSFGLSVCYKSYGTSIAKLNRE